MDQTVYYNVHVKRFPGGKVQYMRSCDKVQGRGYELPERELTGETTERKKVENKKRALNEVYDLCRANDFDWFITLTFDPKKVDSFDYLDCCRAMKLFTQRLRDYHCKYVLVPERHDSGRYHFHGLVSGDFPVTPARHKITGQLVVDKRGRQMYNIDIFDAGFTTATRIESQDKVSTYMSEYITKDLCVPKGKKCYWASRKLARPADEYVIMTEEEFGDIFNLARYTKAIPSAFGDYLFCET